MTQIRLYRSGDLAQITELNTRVKPYRPQDRSEVEAMSARAIQARERQDERWMVPYDTGLPDTPDAFAAFWVAEPAKGTPLPHLVGTVAVRLFRPDLEVASALGFVKAWQSRGDVAELRRLRVAPEVRRQGVGAACARQ
jgi:hypothetical protein